MRRNEEGGSRKRMGRERWKGYERKGKRWRDGAGTRTDMRDTPTKGNTD